MSPKSTDVSNLNQKFENLFMNRLAGGTDRPEKSRTPAIIASGFARAASANIPNSSGGCCPSASSATACVKPLAAASANPAFKASALPRLRGNLKTPHIGDETDTGISEPSSTTIANVPAGSPRTTAHTVSALLWHGTSAQIRTPERGAL